MRGAMATLVMIFLKAPRPGTVKTRLGREIGHDHAAIAYRNLAELQLRRIPGEFRTEIHYAPRGALAEMRQWLGPQRHYRAQSGCDLGQRMSRAFGQGFRRGYDRIVVIGSDCPGLDEGCLRRAGAELSNVEVVLGPAMDGGYYLLGLRRPQPRLFEGIPWSTETVLTATLARVRENGLSYLLLDEKEDIDNLEGWLRHRARDSAPLVAAIQSVASV